MDDTQTFYLKMLVADYLRSRRDEEHLTQELERVKAALELAGDSRHTFQRTLRLKGIDHQNIPPDLLDSEPQPSETQPVDVQQSADTADTAETPIEAPEPAQRPLVAADNTGHRPMRAWPKPVSGSHAFFLIFHRLDNPWMDLDAIYQGNLKFNYGLTKPEIKKIAGRQIPKGTVLNSGDMYKLSPAGFPLGDSEGSH